MHTYTCLYGLAEWFEFPMSTFLFFPGQTQRCFTAAAASSTRSASSSPPPPPPPPPAQACPLFLGALRYQKITPIVSLVNFWSNKGLLRAFYFNWSAGEGRGWQLLGFSFISIVYTFQPRRHPLHHWHNTWPNTLLSHLLTEVRSLPNVCLFGYLWVTKCWQNSKWAGVWKLVPGFVARNRFLEWNVYRCKVFCRKNSESVSVFAAEQNFTNLFNSDIHLADCIQY